MPNWSYGGVRIFVEKDSGPTPEPRIDEINPLTTSLTTYIHQSGRESYSRKITCTVWRGNWELLQALADGSEHALISDVGAEGDWVILSIKPERKQALNESEVVASVQLELMEVA